MLLEHAGEAIPALAAAAGGDNFAPFFAGFLPLLLCKTVSASSSSFKPWFTHVPSACSPTVSYSQADLYSSVLLPNRSRAAQWQKSPLLWGHWQNPFRVWVLPQLSLCLGCFLCY